MRRNPKTDDLSGLRFDLSVCKKHKILKQLKEHGLADMMRAVAHSSGILEGEEGWIEPLKFSNQDGLVSERQSYDPGFTVPKRHGERVSREINPILMSRPRRDGRRKRQEREGSQSDDYVSRHVYLHSGIHDGRLWPQPNRSWTATSPPV